MGKWLSVIKLILASGVFEANPHHPPTTPPHSGVLMVRRYCSCRGRVQEAEMDYN